MSEPQFPLSTQTGQSLFSKPDAPGIRADEYLARREQEMLYIGAMRHGCQISTMPDRQDNRVIRRARPGGTRHFCLRVAAPPESSRNLHTTKQRNPSPRGKYGRRPAVCWRSQIGSREAIEVAELYRSGPCRWLISAAGSRWRTCRGCKARTRRPGRQQ